MPRMLDLECSQCGAEVDDLFVMRVPSRIVHLECGGEMEPVYRLQPKRAQWGDRDCIVVFRKPDGSISYPARNDKPTPVGCERVELRSLTAVDQFCKEHKVHNTLRDFEAGTDRDLSSETARSKMPDERTRYERFRESTRGIF